MNKPYKSHFLKNRIVQAVITVLVLALTFRTVSAVAKLGLAIVLFGYQHAIMAGILLLLLLVVGCVEEVYVGCGEWWSFRKLTARVKTLLQTGVGGNVAAMLAMVATGTVMVVLVAVAVRSGQRRTPPPPPPPPPPPQSIHLVGTYNAGQVLPDSHLGSAEIHTGDGSTWFLDGPMSIQAGDHISIQTWETEDGKQKGRAMSCEGWGTPRFLRGEEVPR